MLLIKIYKMYFFRMEVVYFSLKIWIIIKIIMLLWWKILILGNSFMLMMKNFMIKKSLVWLRKIKNMFFLKKIMIILKFFIINEFTNFFCFFFCYFTLILILIILFFVFLIKKNIVYLFNWLFLFFVFFSFYYII